MTDAPELRPREYARRCAALGSKEERRAYLEEVVPGHFRDWVRLYVEQAFRQGSKR
ncbi:MAG: hypothetical protein AB9Q22_10115 [Candidatus Reddybacter sp.]